MTDKPIQSAPNYDVGPYEPRKIEAELESQMAQLPKDKQYNMVVPKGAPDECREFAKLVADYLRGAGFTVAAGLTMAANNKAYYDVTIVASKTADNWPIVIGPPEP